MKYLGFPLILFFVLLLSCNKDSFIDSPDARVTISADTLKFDTVFVTTGSTYQTLVIRNDNDKKLKLSSIKLMGGAASVFKLNVDGIPGVQFNDISLEANDSVYLFAQVNVNPNTTNLPFILRDSIEIVYNGTKRKVMLEAWGKNAHFYRDKVINANEIWNNDLPYVILGSLFVNTGQMLTINKGCRIYVHADAPIVVNGTMVVNGFKDTVDRVVFTGDRLDEPYKDFPASWPGIFFQSPSINNIFNNVDIINSYQGIALQDPATSGTYKLLLNESKIDNAYETGILAVNSSIRARNCLISNCGNNVYLTYGGNYQFTHCTIVTIGNRYIDHKSPVFQLYNYAKVNGIFDVKPLTATFQNNIFWGENGIVDDEIVDSLIGASPNVSFTNNIWKIQTSPMANTLIGNLVSNPLFDSVNTFKNYYNFRLKYAPPLISPAIDKGPNLSLTIDFEGKPRPQGAGADLGCFEKR